MFIICCFGRNAHKNQCGGVENVPTGLMRPNCMTTNLFTARLFERVASNKLVAHPDVFLVCWIAALYVLQEKNVNIMWPMYQAILSGNVSLQEVQAQVGLSSETLDKFKRYVTLPIIVVVHNLNKILYAYKNSVRHSPIQLGLDGIVTDILESAHSDLEDGEITLEEYEKASMETHSVFDVFQDLWHPGKALLTRYGDTMKQAFIDNLVANPIKFLTGFLLSAEQVNNYADDIMYAYQMQTNALDLELGMEAVELSVDRIQSFVDLLRLIPLAYIYRAFLKTRAGGVPYEPNTVVSIMRDSLLQEVARDVRNGLMEGGRGHRISTLIRHVFVNMDDDNGDALLAAISPTIAANMSFGPFVTDKKKPAGGGRRKPKPRK